MSITTEPSGNCVAFYSQALERTQCNFCWGRKPSQVGGGSKVTLYEEYTGMIVVWPSAPVSSLIDLSVEYVPPTPSQGPWLLTLFARLSALL